MDHSQVVPTWYFGPQERPGTRADLPAMLKSGRAGLVGRFRESGLTGLRAAFRDLERRLHARGRKPDSFWSKEELTSLLKPGS